jgi:hypothetical protein
MSPTNVSQTEGLKRAGASSKKKNLSGYFDQDAAL